MNLLDDARMSNLLSIVSHVHGGKGCNIRHANLGRADRVVGAVVAPGNALTNLRVQLNAQTSPITFHTPSFLSMILVVVRRGVLVASKCFEARGEGGSCLLTELSCHVADSDLNRSSDQSSKVCDAVFGTQLFLVDQLHTIVDGREAEHLTVRKLEIKHYTFRFVADKVTLMTKTKTVRFDCV